jgi:hypothetical protein
MGAGRGAATNKSGQLLRAAAAAASQYEKPQTLVKFRRYRIEHRIYLCISICLCAGRGCPTALHPEVTSSNDNFSLLYVAGVAPNSADVQYGRCSVHRRDCTKDALDRDAEKLSRAGSSAAHRSGHEN